MEYVKLWTDEPAKSRVLSAQKTKERFGLNDQLTTPLTREE